MMKRQYHYLVSGLPKISIDERLPVSVAEFRNHLQVHLHPEDLWQARCVLLQRDHGNILHFLRTGVIPENSVSNFTPEELMNPEDMVAGTAPEDQFMPEYIARFLAENSDNRKTSGKGNGPGEEKIPDLPALQKELDEGFFGLITENGNEFLRKFFAFQYDMYNLLTYIKSGAHKLDQDAFITGDTPHAHHLRAFAGRNLAKDPDMEYFDEITSISSQPSFAEEERQADLLRWRVIDEMNRFEYFTIDRVLGYLLQMQIAERWEQLDRESGEMVLRELVDVSYRNLTEKRLAHQEDTE